MRKTTETVEYRCADCLLQRPVFKVVVCIFLQLFCRGELWSQSVTGPVKWSVTAAAGVQQTFFTDEQAGKLVFSGYSFSPGLNVNRYSARSEMKIELRGTSVTATTKGRDKHNASERFLTFDISQLYFSGSPEQKLRLGAGPSIGGVYVSRQIPDLINAGQFVDLRRQSRVYSRHGLPQTPAGPDGLFPMF